MQFTTPIPIPDSAYPIEYTSGIVSLGSCFAVNIGAKFDYFKFRNITNPFGILFHPAAIDKFIGFAVNHKRFTEADIFFHNEQWHCYDAHSDLSDPEKDVMLSNLNTAVRNMRNALHEATHIFITLGTAWVYRHLESNTVVANCHKVPQSAFIKELLPVADIIKSLQNSIDQINQINSSASVTFTISPVRHSKDGFIENQWSKANLITALHQVLQNNENSKAGYFPSYEIVMDELRDYRFYEKDMLHPNSIAIDYIWERFTQTSITNDAQSNMKEIDSIQRGLLHRPFNTNSAQNIDFRAKLQAKINIIQQRYPHIIF